MIMILDVSCERTIWLMLHLMAKNSASDEVMLTVWWRVLTTGLLKTWMCAMDEVTLFLTLASVIMRALEDEEEDSIAKASSCWRQDLKERSLLLLKEWKEKRLEKVSVTLLPGWSSGLSGSNVGKTSLNLLSISTTWLFKRPRCLLESVLRDKICGGEGQFELLSRSDLMMWLAGIVCPLSWDLPLSFWRWRQIEMRLVITSMPYEGDVLNAPRIHKAALLWSLPNVFNRYDNGALE